MKRRSVGESGENLPTANAVMVWLMFRIWRLSFVGTIREAKVDTEGSLLITTWKNEGKVNQSINRTLNQYNQSINQSIITNIDKSQTEDQNTTRSKE